MTNAVATTSTGTSALAAHEALKAYAAAQKINLMRFASYNNVRGDMLSKDADKAEIVIKQGTKFYLNTAKIAHGYKCWVDSSVKDEVMFYLLERPTLPDIETLPDHGPYEGERDGWKVNLSFPLYQPDEKMGYIFQVSSVSSVNAMNKVIATVIQAAGRDGKDLDQDIPLLELSRGSYKNKSTKKDMFIPNFKVVGWEKANVLNLTVSGLPPKEEKDADSDEAGVSV